MRKNILEMSPDEIRAIRRDLGLTQVEAGELLGGGPRAFTKYEAGTVRPAASVVNLLKLLRMNPAAIATLGGRTAPTATSADTPPFEVTGEHIKPLAERTFPLLLRRLLSAEAHAHDLPQHGIHVASNVTAADGGEDGSIQWTDGPDHTDFLPARFSQFQLKTGRIGPATAGRDVLTRDGTVKARVRAAIAADGCYIMLSAHSCTQKKIEDCEQKIRESLRTAGMTVKDHQVQFRDADQVAAWANRHVPVAVWLKELTQGFATEPFRSWNHWAGRHEHECSAWVEDPRLAELRTTLLERVTQRRSDVRVVGPSGIGKSRLTLEALAPIDEDEPKGVSLSDLVLYANASETDSTSIDNAVQRFADSGQRAVIVVDWCPPEMHRILVGMVLRSSSRLSLITIDHEVPAGTSDQSILRIAEAPSSVTEGIMRQLSPGLPWEDYRRLVRFSKGYPGIAILIARSWADARPIAHAADDDLVDAFVVGRRPREPELLRKCAELLAAFGLVKIDQADDDQLTELAARGRNLTAEDLRFGFLELVRQGAARRRGGAVVIQPRPIALRLAERQWQEWNEADWQQVLAGNGNPRLKVMAARQLALLNTTDVAHAVVRCMCRVGGPFDGIESVSATGHTAVLSALAEVDTRMVARQIERSLGDLEDWSTVQDDVRRNLVRAAEKISFPPDTFEEGARLLLRLAVKENETWANNATGQFKALFPVHLGNTSADGTMRLTVLEEAADTSDPRQRLIVVSALINVLNLTHGSRMAGAESHGSRPALEPWRPATKQERDDYIERGLTLLVQFATGDNESGAAARAGLGRNLRTLVAAGFLDRIEVEIRRIVAAVGPWPEALEGLGHSLKYDRDRMGPEAVGRVKTLMRELTSQDLESRVRLIVTDMPWNFLEEDDRGSESHYKRQIDAVEQLAAELLVQPVILEGVLPQISRATQQIGRRNQRMAAPFGHAIGKLSDSPLDWLEPIVATLVDAPKNERDFELLCGYVTGIATDYPDVVRAFKQRAADSAELAPALPGICWMLGITDEDVELALRAFQAGHLPPRALARWATGGVLGTIPTASLAPLFDAMLDESAEAFAVALDLMSMYVYQRLEKLEELRPQLRKVAENLTQLDRSRFDDTDVHNFECLMQWLLENGRQDTDACATALTLARAVVTFQDHGYNRFIEPIVRPLLREFPEVVWPLIGQAIVSDQVSAWRLQNVLGCHLSSDDRQNAAILSLPQDALFAWCHAHPESAPAYVAAVVPVLTRYHRGTPEPPLLHPVMERLLDEFGDRDDVQRSIKGNIHSYCWWGSPTDYYALYENPLTRLHKEHASPRVRRWAGTMLRELASTNEAIRYGEEEREANWEI